MIHMYTTEVEALDALLDQAVATIELLNHELEILSLTTNNPTDTAKVNLFVAQIKVARKKAKDAYA